MSKKITLTTIAVTTALISLNADAAGFQVNEHSASGLGRAFAGDAAIADNAAVLARNPAAMTRFDRISVSGAISYIDPQIDVRSNDVGETAKDVAPTAIVPAGYFIQPINNRFAWGLALFTNYGFSTEYPKDFHYGADAGMTDLVTLNINPNIAYRINDSFSIGAGVSLVYADAELNRHFGGFMPASPNTELLHLEGDTWEWGWNIGAMWELDEYNRFGLSYRSQVDLDFDGVFTDNSGTGLEGSSPANPLKADGKLSLSLPAIAEFGGFHQLNRQWAVHYGVQWIQWSKFTELKATSSECINGVCLLKHETYDDNFRVSIGGTYTLNREWTLRAGFAFDEQAGQSTLSIPDTDRYWYSAGFTYSYDSQLSVDFGFTYLYGQSSDFTESGASFYAENDAFLSSAQINYTF